MNYNAVTRTLRLSSSSIDSGDGGVGRVGVVGVVGVVLERPKRGNRKGSRVGGDFLSLDPTTGSWALVNELNFSKVPLETIVLLPAASPVTILLLSMSQFLGAVVPTTLSSVVVLTQSPRLIHLRTSGCSIFCLVRLSSTCFHRLAILLVTTFLGGVRFSGGVELSSAPLHVVITVESEPILALLTERLLSAGLPLVRVVETGGLETLIREYDGFFGKAGFIPVGSSDRT